MRTIALLFAATLTLGACATRADPPAVLSLEIAPGQPAPPQSRFYVDCITHAAAANTYDREANVLRFRCEGDVAQRFYDGLGPWSAEIGSEIARDGRIWRFSTVIERNPSFVDFCWREGESYSCTVVLNVGEFLAE